MEPIKEEEGSPPVDARNERPVTSSSSGNTNPGAHAASMSPAASATKTLAAQCCASSGQVSAQVRKNSGTGSVDSTTPAHASNTQRKLSHDSAVGRVTAQAHAQRRSLQHDLPPTHSLSSKVASSLTSMGSGGHLANNLLMKSSSLQNCPPSASARAAVSALRTSSVAAMTSHPRRKSDTTVANC